MNGALDGALGCALDAVAHAICSASVEEAYRLRNATYKVGAQRYEITILKY